MRPVSIVGIGQTKVGELWDHSLRDLAVEATLVAMDDARVTSAGALFVGNMLSGLTTGQEHLGALIADWAGLAGVEAYKVEAACASAAAALRVGIMAVGSGMHDVVVVTGVEKMTDRSNGEVTAALATASDADFEAAEGVTFVGLNALLMRRYMYEYGVPHEAFGAFSVNAHRNAAGNPFAMFPKPISVDAFRQARMVADPINLLDSSPMADGAASVILVPSEQAREFCNHPIQILASTVATDRLAVHDRRDPLWLEAAYCSSQTAYRQAGVGPQGIDIFEAHDAFTIMAALSLEAAGFAERGQAVRLAEKGEIRREGRIPISTMGGLKGRGHPVGATGLYQIVDLVEQLRGEAGINQVDARTGMAQNIGGSGATAITHILAAQS